MVSGADDRHAQRPGPTAGGVRRHEAGRGHGRGVGRLDAPYQRAGRHRQGVVARASSPIRSVTLVDGTMETDGHDTGLDANGVYIVLSAGGVISAHE